MHPDLGHSMYEGLEDYAVLFIYALFCTKRRSDGLRYYETGLLEIARKNFKTFTAAVIFIIGLLTEPQFSRFFSVAPDLKLSSELHNAVKKIECRADGNVDMELRSLDIEPELVIENKPDFTEYENRIKMLEYE